MLADCLLCRSLLLRTASMVFVVIIIHFTTRYAVSYQASDEQVHCNSSTGTVHGWYKFSSSKCCCCTNKCQISVGNNERHLQVCPRRETARKPHESDAWMIIFEAFELAFRVTSRHLCNTRVPFKIDSTTTLVLVHIKLLLLL